MNILNFMYYDSYSYYDDTTTVLLWIFGAIFILGFLCYRFDRWLNDPNYYDDYGSGNRTSSNTYTPKPKKSLPKKGESIKEESKGSFKSPPVSEFQYGSNMKVRVFSEEAKSLEDTSNETC